MIRRLSEHHTELCTYRTLRDEDIREEKHKEKVFEIGIKIFSARSVTSSIPDDRSANSSCA
jgi:hypothetical protein